jgi:hypothetical protein
MGHHTTGTVFYIKIHRIIIIIANPNQSQTPILVGTMQFEPIKEAKEEAKEEVIKQPTN